MKAEHSWFALSVGLAVLSVGSALSAVWRYGMNWTLVGVVVLFVVMFPFLWKRDEEPLKRGRRRSWGYLVMALAFILAPALDGRWHDTIPWLLALAAVEIWFRKVHPPSWFLRDQFKIVR